MLLSDLITFKSNTAWVCFHLDRNDLAKTLRRNSFPSNVIENVVRRFLDNNFIFDSSRSTARKDNCLYFKLLSSVLFPPQRKVELNN